MRVFYIYSDLDGNARNLRIYHCKIKTLFAYLAAIVPLQLRISECVNWKLCPFGGLRLFFEECVKFLQKRHMLHRYSMYQKCLSFRQNWYMLIHEYPN